MRLKVMSTDFLRCWERAWLRLGQVEWSNLCSSERERERVRGVDDRRMWFIPVRGFGTGLD